MTDDNYLEEGDKCPCCESSKVYFHSQNCSCHLSAPCYSCEKSDLKCDKRGELFEEGYFDETEH